MNSTAWTLYSFVWITLLIIKSMNPEASHVTNSDKSNKFTRIKIAKKRANKRCGRFLEGRIWFIINLCWSLSVQAPFSHCRSSNHDKSHMKWSKNGKKMTYWNISIHVFWIFSIRGKCSRWGNVKLMRFRNECQSLDSMRWIYEFIQPRVIHFRSPNRTEPCAITFHTECPIQNTFTLIYELIG